MNNHIPKKIHISWKNKDILNNNSIFIRKCINSIVNLSESWDAIVYDDGDIEDYIKNNLDYFDYRLLKEKHIVEKCDVWRLIKMFNEGGLYVDIDRLCNVSINNLLEKNIKMLLPTCGDYDFSHDFMCSAPNNPIFLETLKLNLERRYQGHNNIYFLGPQTYFHGVTKSLLGEMINVDPGKDIFEEIRNIITDSGFISTYVENPPFNTILYRPEKDQIDFDYEKEKRIFYKEQNIKHWTNEW